MSSYCHLCEVDTELDSDGQCDMCAEVPCEECGYCRDCAEELAGHDDDCTCEHCGEDIDGLLASDDDDDEPLGYGGDGQ